MGPADIAAILSRFFHIMSAIALLGGLIFARVVRHGRLTMFYKPVIVASVTFLLVSGFNNFLAKVNTPKPYHMVFGIKFLLALHVIAVAFVATKPHVDEQKRDRQLLGVIISGMVIVLLSSYLRWLSR